MSWQPFPIPFHDRYVLGTPDRFEDDRRDVLLDGPEDDDPRFRDWNPDPDDFPPAEFEPDVPQPDPFDLDRFVDDGGAVADPPGGES